MPEVPPPAPTGDALLKILTALGNPHRMRIVAALVENRTYVSALAREIGISRPLLHMHLQRLEAAGLVTGTLEAADDGKTVKYYDVTPFVCELTPHTVACAAATLTDDGAGTADRGTGRSDRGAKEEAK
ncbi:winged helix-turn-helix domain-containing protein [Streptomyces labedae]|uniref:Winged helix-turn-helix domain-containing protein n=1 Tax=Streptomyces labedae TaxID=285569 RepID=A0ABP6R726_9ACTN